MSAFLLQHEQNALAVCAVLANSRRALAIAAEGMWSHGPRVYAVIWSLWTSEAPVL